MDSRKVILLILSFINVLGVHAKELPPILDYYPGCDYTVLGLLVEKGVVTTAETEEYLSREREQDFAKLLTKLQTSAADLGADALIITNLEKSTRLKGRELTKGDNDIVFQYTAEAIKLCANENEDLRRPTGFDQVGIKRNSLSISKSKIEIEIEIEIGTIIRQTSGLVSLLDGQDINTSQLSKNNSLKNKEVSLSGSIYGISLGSSRAQVISEFGYPSAEFKLLSGTGSMLYGRRHWLHFKQDKLVSIEFTDQILSYDSLNLIDAKEQFDQFEWRIEQNIKLNTSIKDVREVFKNISVVDDNNQLKISENNVELSLVFDTEYDPLSTETKKYLVGFTLAYSNTPKFNTKLSTVTVLDIDNILEAAKAGQFPTIEKLSATLLEPVGRIFAGERNYYDIFDNHLMIKHHNKKISEINMREAIFKAPRIQAPKKPWKLTQVLYQGAVVESIQQYFENEFSIILGKASIHFPHLQIRFYVDGDDESASLYATDLIL